MDATNMSTPSGGLPAIPVVDLRDGGPAWRAGEASARARGLRDACVDWLPRPASALLPVFDKATRRWLRRSRSPYIGEVEAIVATLGFVGIWFLNGCYQWGCTSLAREQGGAPWLARTLDWPFPGLGRYLEVAHMRGPAGDFDNVTWPGYVGSLTASAPGRFAACLNQAPMRRRTRRPWLRPYDIALNARRTWRIRSIPPDHLLRNVFETCRSYGEAKERLETTPVARPAIYTLVGCAPGERCVIERTEDSFNTREDETSAANDWINSAWPWEARVRTEVLLTRSYEEAAQNSRTRRAQIAAWDGTFSGEPFRWVAPPILNTQTRVAVELCPAQGILRAVGYEPAPDLELPAPATAVCQVGAATVEPAQVR
jgi:hypothetical protein